jgi:hypothetical protein
MNLKCHYSCTYMPCLFPPHRPKAPRLTDLLTAFNLANHCWYHGESPAVSTTITTWRFVYALFPPSHFHPPLRWESLVSKSWPRNLQAWDTILEAQLPSHTRYDCHQRPYIWKSRLLTLSSWSVNSITRAINAIRPESMRYRHGCSNSRKAKMPGKLQTPFYGSHQPSIGSWVHLHSRSKSTYQGGWYSLFIPATKVDYLKTCC